MSENRFKKINKVAITTLIFCNFIKAEPLNNTDDDELLWGKNLKEEEEYKLVYKTIDLKKVYNSLPEYKKIENTYKRYIEEQQKLLTNKAEGIKNQSEDLENKWAERKIELKGI